MSGKLLTVSVGLVLLLALVGVIFSGAVTAQPDEATSAPAPEQVTAEFYNWYLGYIRGDDEAASGMAMRNPLVDGAYRDCGYLTDGFVAEIDETLASFDKGAFDPILLAQDVPVRIDVGASDVTDDEAIVPVAMYWGGNPTLSERLVTLHKVDGAWQVAGVGFTQ
jgi:hypothetical protein